MQLHNTPCPNVTGACLCVSVCLCMSLCVCVCLCVLRVVNWCRVWFQWASVCVCECMSGNVHDNKCTFLWFIREYSDCVLRTGISNGKLMADDRACCPLAVVAWEASKAPRAHPAQAIRTGTREWHSHWKEQIMQDDRQKKMWCIH